MAELANLTGSSKRWVIELMQRLEKKHFIRTDGGSGAVKWIWQLPPGVLRLGKASPTELAQRMKTSPGKAKALRAAGSRPNRGRKKPAPSSKPEAEVNVAPPVEKPVEKPSEIPARRRKGPALSIPPAEAAAPDDPAVLATALIPPPPDDPAVLATALIPPPPPAPANPMSPAVNPPATPSTTKSDVARRYDAATATCNAPRRSGARQSGGGYRHGDTSTFKGTRRPRSAQAKRARRQDRAAAFHRPRRPCSKQLGGARRHDAASAVFRGPGRPGSS